MKISRSTVHKHSGPALRIIGSHTYTNLGLYAVQCVHSDSGVLQICAYCTMYIGVSITLISTTPI